MKILVWTLRLAILLVLVWFSVKNADLVTLHAYPYEWRAPLVLVILAFFSAGVLLGLLASLGSIWRLKREVSGLKKDLKARDNAASIPVANAQSAGVGDHGV